MKQLLEAENIDENAPAVLAGIIDAGRTADSSRPGQAAKPPPLRTPGIKLYAAYRPAQEPHAVDFGDLC